jgi:branched-subunit amino acid transport protein
MVIAAVLALAVGTYAFRLAGVVLGDRLELPDGLRRLLMIAAATLLAALAATAALTDAGRHAGLHAGVARPVGVLVGAVLAWRRAPFVVVVLAAALTAAGLRLVGVP